MTSIATDHLAALIQAWDEGAWGLAAVALTAREDTPPELAAAAQELLSAAGLTDRHGRSLVGLPSSTAQQIASQVAAPLHQTSALASGGNLGWEAQSDQALLAQGHASAQAAAPFAQFILPMMGDLADRLAASGARMLDVGTGVAALAIAFAQVFPQVHVLGIDILDRALDLGRQAIAVSDVAGRVTVRKQDVADFSDDSGFDLIWLPAPFIPQAALHKALPRLTAALRPGGWVMVGHGRSGDSAIQATLTKLKTVAYGGTPLDEMAARSLLHDVGLTSVRVLPMPPGAPGITIGQKPG